MLGAGPVALSSGAGPWFAAELQAVEVLEITTGQGLTEGELLGVEFGRAGAAVSAMGLAHVVVPLRLTEPDFTRKKPPLS